MLTAAYTAAACRIARLERKKFDAVMASGEYNCAPNAPHGMPRIFEIPDLIGLFLFARLNERGQTVKQAAGVACRVVGQLKNAVNNGLPLPEHVAVAHAMNGASYCCTGTDANPLASQIGGVGSILWTEMWNVANLKEEVQRGLAEEERIAGGADE